MPTRVHGKHVQERVLNGAEWLTLQQLRKRYPDAGFGGKIGHTSSVSFGRMNKAGKFVPYDIKAGYLKPGPRLPKRRLKHSHMPPDVTVMVGAGALAPSAEVLTMDRLLELEKWANNCVSESLRQRAKWPTCSRCLKPLVCRDAGPMPLRAHVVIGDASASGYEMALSRKYEWHCPDRCASVTARWAKATQMLREDCCYSDHKCSRCGETLLMRLVIDDTIDAGVRFDFWCPGCGPVE